MENGSKHREGLGEIPLLPVGFSPQTGFLAQEHTWVGLAACDGITFTYDMLLWQKQAIKNLFEKIPVDRYVSTCICMFSHVS